VVCVRFGWGDPSQIVAEVDATDPNAVVRATPLAMPFATMTTFSVSIVAMPPARAALTRAMATVNLNKRITAGTELLADAHRSGVGDGGRRGQEAGASQNPECIEHLYSHNGSRTTVETEGPWVDVSTNSESFHLPSGPAPDPSKDRHRRIFDLSTKLC